MNKKTRRIHKKNITKRKNNVKKTKKVKLIKRTRKNIYGGGKDKEKYDEIYKFRTEFIELLDNIYTINSDPNNSNNDKKKSIDPLNAFFDRTKDNVIAKKYEYELINTLIPITQNGVIVDKTNYPNYSNTTIYDFVSPITVIFEKLSNVITTGNMQRILNAYKKNGGEFNNPSSRLKTTPLIYELNKPYINKNNVELLLIYIDINTLDNETKNKINVLRNPPLPPPTDTSTVSLPPPPPPDTPPFLLPPTPPPTDTSTVSLPPPTPIISNLIMNEKLNFDLPLPENNEVGYDTTIIPEFWKPIFPNDDLIQIRNKFMEFYEKDKYIENNRNPVEICQLLKQIIPKYWIRNTLVHNELPKTMVNVNILNCVITLIYGMILYRLYNSNQKYIFIFKGGRSIQINIPNIDSINEYISEDTDILIIPNPDYEGSSYDLIEMQKLSEHIAYLIKWMIKTTEINIFVSLISNPKNTNKTITKLLYNDGKIYKALSDIGFGEINENVKQFFKFDELKKLEFDINDLKLNNYNEKNILFIVPTLDNILAEKLFYYTKYLNFETIIKENEKINEPEYTDLKLDECEFQINKFFKAIIVIIKIILEKNKNDKQILNSSKKEDFEESKKILSEFLKNIEIPENKTETIINRIYPTIDWYFEYRRKK